MAGKLAAEVEVKSGVAKYWDAIMDSVNLLPKATPKFYKSIQVLEGDGMSVGSVRLVHFGEGSPLIRSAKEKVEVLDTVNRKLSYGVIEGDLMKYYKTYKIHTEVIPKEDGDGSLVKWLCEFEKVSEEIPDPIVVRDSALEFFIQLDDYLLKA